jgi:DNA end-binding protein Ku
MAARATASGTISFGLVSIPVKVYTATSSKSLHFNMLHDKDRARLKQKYICTTCGEEVARDATVKGYEYTRDQFVILTDDELKGLQRKTDQAIEIEEFVPIEQVDPVYFEKSNLLGPDKGGTKAYRLLRDAMTKSGKVAVGRFSTRGRQQLVLLRPARGGILLHGLYYADEVRDFADVEIDETAAVKDAELELAQQLIEQLSQDRFEPAKYEDEYRSAVLAAVERKVAGQEIVAAKPEEAREQIIDLVAALKKSLAEKRAAAGGAEAAGERKPAVAKGKKSAPRRSSSG